MTIQPVSDWVQEWMLFSGMTQESNNPSDVVGSNEDPMQIIVEELQSSHPDATVIREQLNKLQDGISAMIRIAVAGKLNPASDPHFIPLMQGAENLIEKLQSEVGQPSFTKDFNQLKNYFGSIEQDILQGSSVGKEQLQGSGF